MKKITRRAGVIIMAALLPAISAAAAGRAATGEPIAPAGTDPNGSLEAIDPGWTAAPDVTAGGMQSDAAADALERLLKNIEPKQAEQLVAKAVESRLKVERDQAAGEIKEDLLADPADIDAAVKILQADPANTQKDNIDRIIRAFGKIDPHMDKARKLLAAGEYAAAAEAIEKDLDSQDTSYHSAARYMVYARALAGEGKYYDAADAYEKILTNMADRISFAAAAAIESASAYEKRQRFMYALEMYRYAVENYRLTLDRQVTAEIDKKIKEYEKVASDPIGWTDRMMSQVTQRLDNNDSGRDTQAKEEKIIAVITDLIRTAEEKQNQNSQQSSSSRQQRQKGQRQSSSRQSSSSQGQAGSPNRPRGTRQPSNPARISALVAGTVARPTARSQVRNTGESGDWAELPPRQRQKLLQLRKKVLSERYRDLIKKYRTRIAEQRPR
ncbi:MAG: hypothetical protein J7M21_01635 [Planctomycetes bacterium]|nr:hypothetical protein [Planctomycetota bacterium]